MSQIKTQSAPRRKPLAASSVGSVPIAQYDSPHQFEPLLPSEATMAPLLERASDLLRAATTLGGMAAPSAQMALRALLRSMNSYYSNRIEGEHTRPSDIERALLSDFSKNSDHARKQRLALAHIRTEESCERALNDRLIVQSSGRTAAGPAAAPSSTAWLYSAPALGWLHAQLFNALPRIDLALPDGTQMVPGALRQRGVAVGQHEPPKAAALPAFIARWAEVYGGVRRGEAAIVAAAASHHRLAWMHPFLDGNGRVARLHTHLLLHSMGLTQGLWSPLRGFARSEPRYKALLQAADGPRRGALDGRGSLSQSALIDWIAYTLELCIDQVEFMAKQLHVPGMRDRLSAALSYEESTLKSGVRREALMPLHYLFATQGELGRADFKTMLGLGDRVATEAVSALLRHGFVASDTPYGALRFAIPRRALRFYFPALWPEAEQDQALLEAEGHSPVLARPVIARPALARPALARPAVKAAASRPKTRHPQTRRAKAAAAPR